MSNPTPKKPPNAPKPPPTFIEILGWLMLIASIALGLGMTIWAPQ
jgi:hypothetical protein